MSISIGDQPVTALSIGDTPVTRVWIGDVLYWQKSLDDIDLDAGEFTLAQATAKGWVPENVVLWQTSYAKLYNSVVTGQPTTQGKLSNSAVAFVPGANYQFSANITNVFGSGGPGLAIRAEDSQGILAETFKVASGLMFLNFVAREENTTLIAEEYNFTNDNSTNYVEIDRLRLQSF